MDTATLFYGDPPGTKQVYGPPDLHAQWNEWKSALRAGATAWSFSSWMQLDEWERALARCEVAPTRINFIALRNAVYDELATAAAEF